jgi:hypothetical protein
MRDCRSLQLNDLSPDLFDRGGWGGLGLHLQIGIRIAGGEMDGIGGVEYIYKYKLNSILKCRDVD